MSVCLFGLYNLKELTQKFHYGMVVLLGRIMVIKCRLHTENGYFTTCTSILFLSNQRLLNLPTPDWITDEVYYTLANDIHKLRWIWMMGGNNWQEKITLFCGELQTQ